MQFANIRRQRLQGDSAARCVSGDWQLLDEAVRAKDAGIRQIAVVNVIIIVVNAEQLRRLANGASSPPPPSPAPPRRADTPVETSARG